MAKNTELTQKEKDFCDLYVNGCSPYAGNLRKCYEEVFEDSSPTILGKAKKLLAEDKVQEYVQSLQDDCIDGVPALKRRVTETLLKIVDETSTAVYSDRRGTQLSPAPLRSVAVQSMKLLSDLYPIKEAQETKLNIESAEGGVVFNVIVPEINKPDKEDIQ